MSVEATIEPQEDSQTLVERLSEGATDRQRKEIESASRFIHEERRLVGDAAEDALRRAADAIVNGIRVFVSHRSEDSELATEFAAQIQRYGADRLARDEKNEPDVFVAEHDIRGSAKWRSTLETAIRAAHWFILLLPDVDFRRDWPIYEAGYFKRGMAQTEKLICVHHEKVARPHQIEDFQAFQSTPDGISKMFIELFFQPNAVPGIEKIGIGVKKDEDLPGDAERLSRLFQGPRPSIDYQHCMRFFEIEHQDARDYEPVEDLLEAQISTVHDVDDAFGRSDDFRGTFKELIGKLEGEYHGASWIEGLRRQLHAAVESDTTRQLDIPFQGLREGAAFRAIVHCVHRDGHLGPIRRFHVVLVEEFDEQISNAPPALDALETSLRWCYRSWWEILNRYRRVLRPEQVDAIRGYTERAEQEVLARGVDNDVMLTLFEDDQQAHDRLKANQLDYYTNYRNPEGTGKLDLAFRSSDPRLMQECLEELRENIIWFMKEASQRYAREIAKLK